LLGESLILSQELGDHTIVPLNLESLATLAADQGELERAARLWGAAEALRTALGAPVPLNRRERYGEAIASLRSRVGDAAFDAAWSAGRAMSGDAAIRYALTSSVDAAREMESAGLLSPREREVAALIAAGLTSRDIARRLVISERTADAHADHIRAKLGLRSRTEIAVWATENGLRDGSNSKD
jgi:non-specific serine/threonine protein kinase